MSVPFETQVAEHYRWNYGIIAAVEGVWGLGSALVSHVVILPVFLDRLGASPVLVGLLPATFALFLTGPQLLAARLTGHLPRKKIFFTFVHYPGCLSLLALGGFVIWQRDGPESLIIAATFVWLAMFGLCISFAMPMWVNLMAKLFPPSLRGKSVGDVFLLGSVTGAVGSMCAAKALATFAFPYNFAVLFFAAGVLLSGCVTTFLWLREPSLHHDDHPAEGRFLRDTIAAVKGAPSYVWFLMARFVGGFGLMAAAFYTVAAVARFQLPTATAGMFGAAHLLGRSVGSLVAGRLGDRFGFKWVATMAPAAMLGAALLAVFAPSATWYYPVFILFGFRISFGMVGVHNLAIEFCPTADKTSFIALSSTAVCPAFVLGPWLGGLLAERHPAGYTAVFVVASLCCAASLLMMVFCVKEPRRANVVAAPQ